MEHISNKKNAVNLNGKFAFINNMVGIEVYIHCCTTIKKSLIQAREDQKAVDFSIVFSERHRGENVLILQSYIKPAITDVQSNFADINLLVQLNTSY